MVPVEGRGVWGKSLYLPFNVIVNLKLLFKNSFKRTQDPTLYLHKPTSLTPLTLILVLPTRSFSGKE